MIDDALGAFLEGPVMMVAAARGPDGRAAIARGLGARRNAADGVEMFASRWQWPQALAGLAPGDAVAMTFCRPTDYSAYQVKGELIEVGPAADEDMRVAEAYLREVSAVLVGLGVQPRQIACWLTLKDLVRLAVRPRVAFLQTPGPTAGAAVRAPA